MNCLLPMVGRPTLRAARAIGILLVALTAWGCEGDDSAQSPAAGGANAGTTVTGNERLAWDQQATSIQTVNSYTFTVFVDGNPAGTLAASCSATSSAGAFSCAAALPSMSAGAHVLAIRTTDPNGQSSPLSAGLSITVEATRSIAMSMTALAESAMLRLAQVCMGDGPARICYQLNRTATNLTAPADPTEMPDGRIVVLDQGVPLEVEGGAVRPVSADLSRDTRIADFSVPSDGQATREVYALEVSDTPGRRMVDVVRFRDVNGVLGQRAVVVPGIPLPNDGDPALLVDKDLLVAVPRQGDGADTGPGLILRYDRNGRPAGRSIASPALAWGPGRPTALMPMGDRLAAAGVAPGPFAFGALTADGTTPVSTLVTQSLTTAGGVRAVARVGQFVLFAAGDGSAYVGGANANGEPISLQKVDTRGAVVTGLATTRRGTIVATAQLPVDGVPSGRVYELTPVRNGSGR